MSRLRFAIGGGSRRRGGHTGFPVGPGSESPNLIRLMLSPRLTDHTTLRLGGAAGQILAAGDERSLIDAVRDADAEGTDLLLIGGGSNIVAADENPADLAVLIATTGITIDGDLVRVAAGESWDPFVARCVSEGRDDVACLSGIPGSIGATPIQNVGAYGQEVAALIASVRVFDRVEGTVRVLDRDACEFGYRTSRFKRDPARFVVLDVTFRLPVGGGCEVHYGELATSLGVAVGERIDGQAVRDAVLALRRGKGMVLDPADPDTVSAGSFFTNPLLEPEHFAALEQRVRKRLGDGVVPPRFPAANGSTAVKTSAAWLIERAGFSRGYGSPTGIAISSKHVLALTNRGSGTTAELVKLAREIATGVEDAFGVTLVPEPVFVGHRW